MTKRTAVCTMDWSTIDERVELGARFPLVRESFSNGEGQVTLLDSNGKQFTVPDCFFDIEAN